MSIQGITQAGFAIFRVLMKFTGIHLVTPPVDFLPVDLSRQVNRDPDSHRVLRERPSYLIWSEK